MTGGEARAVERFSDWPRRQRWFIRALFGIIGILVGYEITPVFWPVIAMWVAWLGPYALIWLFDPEPRGEMS
jgi:hypothetical protein